MANGDRFDLSTPQAAEILGYHEDTIKRWAKSGQLAAMRTPGGRWRFRRSDLDAFVEARTTGAAS